MSPTGRFRWATRLCDTVRGANVNLYSLIKTAKANNIDPYQCLRRVLAELPNAKTLEDVEALLPCPAEPTNTGDVKSAVG